MHMRCGAYTAESHSIEGEAEKGEEVKKEE